MKPARLQLLVFIPLMGLKLSTRGIKMWREVFYTLVVLKQEIFRSKHSEEDAEIYFFAK